jgi:hypothetical protein
MKTRQQLPYGITLILALLALLGTGTASSMAQAQPDERCFPETNQCISGPIRAYWERNGGLPIFGYPISPQRVETVEGQSLPVQWFERDRLEDHGAQGVMAGRLGARYLELTYRPWEYFDKVDPATIPAGCQFFAPTGHSLCEPYLSYWRANGGLARFGYPITQPFAESIETSNSDTRLVEVPRFATQYFERRRMEIHPELAGTPILLGLLGSEVLRAPEPSTTYPDCLRQAPPSLLPAIAKLHLGAPIGCPSGATWVNLPAATQQFEHGEMIWLSERKAPQLFGYPPTIFALINPGPTRGYYDSDTWVAGQDPDTPPATPPHAGLYAPWRGFGKVWSEHPDVRNAIGWATEPQAQPRTVDIQLFSTALLMRINETGVVYAFGNANNGPPVQVITR